MSTLKRLPLLLYSYIATEMLAPFFASFLILYSVFFLVTLLPMLDVVLDLKIGLADFIRLACYIFPHMLLYVIPMACMTGVIVGFTRLTNDREMLVLKSSGISLRQILPPVFLIALFIAILTGFFSVKLVPAGELAMKQLMFQLAKEKISKGLQEKTFTEALGDMVVYVDQVGADDHWQGVYVSDMRNRQQPIIIMAEGGYLDAEIEKMMVTITLNNGTLHHSEGPESQVIRFQRYQIQIPLQPPTEINGDQLTLLDRSSMTQRQLLDAADKYGRDERRGIVFLTEYHHRLALPVGCLILSLLGLPLGLQSGPGRQASGIPLGLFFFIFYYILTTFGIVLTEDFVVPVIIGLWLPNVVFLVLVIIVFRRVEREKPIISDSIHNWMLDMYDKFPLPVIRRVRRLVTLSLQWRPGRYDYGEVVPPEDTMVHASTMDREYHVPGCELYDCPQCTIQFKNARVAEEAGFKPCKLCCGD
ncbi:MAG TPA: LPS export ABC transporter permease LptF [Desulfobacteraceae bacterium]|nr:LPS export ABC transporter permease LptF [Desulfobacteraceae bacterium]